jgi:ABC-type Fe3+ transport system substrate-binding protein
MADAAPAATGWEDAMARLTHERGGNRLLRVLIALAAVLIFAPQAGAAESWTAIVKAAGAEGEVDVHGGPGKLYHEVLTDGFRRAYPQIRINFSGLSGRDAIPKIVRERAAGVYSFDVYIGGTSSVLEGLKPAGALAPIKPALILPEVLDDHAWSGGLFSGFIDTDRRYVLGFEAMASPTAMVNWDFVSHKDLGTFADLLKPEFAGKIVWDDPRLPGEGGAAGSRLLVNFGADFLKRLYTQQKIAYIANPRQVAEWVVRGTHPIGIGASFEALKPFQQQGLGGNVSGFDAPVPHPVVAVGFGSVSLMDHAPHPNAAKVYINWLLSKAGQTEWGKTGHDSRRLDVPHPWPQYLPKPGVTYFYDQSEENIHYRREAVAIARKYIGTQP